MRPTLALASFALLATLLAPLVASAAPAVDLDVRDATGDSRAYPDVRLPQTDITRFTTSIQGSEVVQTVHVVGPWPENDHGVEIRNDFGFSESYTMEVERMNSSGSSPKPTDYSSSLYSTLDPAKMGKDVEFTFAREGNTITFRWPASEIPANAKCVAPRVSTISRTVVDGQRRQVDDDLVVSPSPCNGNARLDGLAGACVGSAPGVLKPGALQDGRDDVGERDGLAFRPYDNATLDLVSLDTRVEDGWVVHEVALAEPSPRDQVDLSLLIQYTGNESSYEQGRQITLSLLGTDAIGSITNDSGSATFHVRAERLEPVGWELRWCASILPEEATCFAPLVRASMMNGRYQDTLGLPKDPCPAATQEATQGDEEDGSGASRDGDTGTEADTEDAAKDSPGFGLVAVGAAFVVALVLRRRG